MVAIPRHKLVPSANSPQLLFRLLEMVARGVRSSRGLQETLGIDLRTVQYYTQAGEWLGLMQSDGNNWLTPLGLELVYAGARRPEVYARAVWGVPFVAELMEARPLELPSTHDIATAIAKVDPKLSSTTVERRASAIQSLIAPAIGFPRPEGEPLRQLALPLASSSPELDVPALDEAEDLDYNPDVYRFLLCALLDHGELTLGHVRALLDEATATEAPIGGYVDMAVARGDARRLDERLIVTARAVQHRQITESTPSVILSDPGYRHWLADLELEDESREAAIRRGRVRVRYRPWDVRLFGRAAKPETVQTDLDRVLMERSLASFPVRGDPGPPLGPAREAFLDCWEQPGLAIALPPYLTQLVSGVSMVNKALKAARQGHDTVGLPGPAYRPVVFHCGVLHPGSPLPRSLPDTRSLRQYLLMHAPYPALVSALLLAHRLDPTHLEVAQRRGRWAVRVRRQHVGELLEAIDDFATRRGWIACRRPQGSLDSGRILELLETLGVASVAGHHAVLSESFFSQLRTEAEEMEVHERLVPLAEAMADFFHGVHPGEGDDEA